MNCLICSEECIVNVDSIRLEDNHKVFYYIEFHRSVLEDEYRFKDEKAFYNPICLEKKLNLTTGESPNQVLANINEALVKLYKISKIVNFIFSKKKHPFTYSVTGLKALFTKLASKQYKIELIQNFSLINNMHWLFNEKRDPSFVDGIKIILSVEDLYISKKIWLKFYQKYKSLFCF